MKLKPEGQRQAVAQFVAKCFGIVMVVLYIAIGTTIIFKSPELDNVPRNYSIVFGVLLILYGLFRALKVYRNHFERSSEQL